MTRRRFARAAGIVLLAAAAAAGWSTYRRSGRRPSTTYETAPVERGPIVARVTATGTLSALVTVQVGSQVSGRVQQIFADFGARVRKGQLIARIDPRLFQAALEQARANVAAARGNLAKTVAQAVDADKQLERARGLHGEGVVSQAELDTAQANGGVARAQVAAAQGAVEQATAALNQAQVNLDYTTILSPIEGVVISRSVDVGQTVAASLQAPTLFTIAEDLRKMQVDTNVAEADVGKLRPGLEATFTVDAFPAERFRGTVRQVRDAPQTLQNVVTYDAVIDVDNPALKLKPGMTANVTFVYAEAKAVVRVPNAALRFEPPAEPEERGPGGAAGGPLRRRARRDGTPDQRTVWLLRDGRPAPVPLRVGLTDGSATEVVEGALRPGDLVITDAVRSGGGGAPRPGGQPSPFRRIF